MKITANSNSITITGNIKTIKDFQDIKKSVEQIIQNNKSLTINIPDSISLTSTIIGYLNKLVLKDNINIKMLIGDEGLYELLDDLSLISTFRVQKISK